MHLTRHAAVLLLAVLLALPARGATAISAAVQDKIDEFMQLRMELAACTTPEEALDAIEGFREANRDFCTTECTQEEALILENFIVLERYNYIKLQPGTAAALLAEMEAQKGKNDLWFKTHGAEQPNKWLYCTAADTVSCFMSMSSSLSVTLKYGYAVKNYYEKAVAQDAGFSYALINLGQWHFYAPRIAGGGKKKARAFFERAVAAARNPGERYFANIYYSQLLFETRNPSGCAAALAAADGCFPGGTFVAKIRRLNAQGMSLFDYNLHNSAVEAPPLKD